MNQLNSNPPAHLSHSVTQGIVCIIWTLRYHNMTDNMTNETNYILHFVLRIIPGSKQQIQLTAFIMIKMYLTYIKSIHTIMVQTPNNETYTTIIELPRDSNIECQQYVIERGQITKVIFVHIQLKFDKDLVSYVTFLQNIIYWILHLVISVTVDV